MKLFPWQQKQNDSKHRKTRTGKKKTLDDILDKALVNKAQNDKDWALQMALQKENLKIDSSAEKQQKKIDEFITTKAFEKLQDEESDFLDDAVKDKIANIVTGSGKSRRHREESGVYLEPGSSLSSALDEIDTLEELKARLVESGMVSGGGGFLQGMTLRDILAALPSIAALMGKAPPPEGIESVQTQRTFVVKVNGQDKEVPEIEYKKMLQQGKIAPVAALVESQPPKKEKAEGQVEKEQSTTANMVGGAPTNATGGFTGLDLSTITTLLENIEPEVIEAYLDMSPEEFVLNLRSEVDTGINMSKFLWGFFSNTNYEGVVKLLSSYKDNERWNLVIERILSNEGKEWVTKVIELIKNFEK